MKRSITWKHTQLILTEKDKTQIQNMHLLILQPKKKKYEDIESIK